MSSRVLKLVFVLLVVYIAAPVLADRTRLKPGINIFTPEQDIEMGRQVARDAESRLEIMKDPQAAAYVDALGKRLAAKAPGGQQYPFQFKIVNDTTINAFALPGGFVYVNRGTLETSANEAQLAGVLAHEIGHVVLRHGTNQISKSYVLQMPLSVLGGALGSTSITSVLARIGGGFTESSVLLRNSRDAESQADLMGAQIIFDAGYDPREMAKFFEKLEVESKTGKNTQFFSDHPNPENRIGNVNKEIEKLGGAPPDALLDSDEFQAVKKIVSGAFPPAASLGRAASPGRRSADPAKKGPAKPSSRLVDFQMGSLQFRRPENWLPHGEGSAVTLAPKGGIVAGALQYGMMVAVFEPRANAADHPVALSDAFEQLINQLHQSNPEMDTTREHIDIRVGGQAGVSIEITNRSPAGGFETDLLELVQTPDGTYDYFIGVAPEAAFPAYRVAFDQIAGSVRFR